jgi:hypothetical protein
MYFEYKDINDRIHQVFSYTDDKNIPNFTTKDVAHDYMIKLLDDEFEDNYRFSYCDDADGLTEYADAIDNGCCGSFDVMVKVNGRLALVGCNYGH